MDFSFVTKPYDHQREALVVANGAPAFAYLMEMRTGKTKVIIDEVAALYNADKVRTLVVVAPLGVHAAWVEEEWEKHGNKENVCFHVYRGGGTKTEQLEIQKLVTAKGLAVFTINWDALITANGWGAINMVLSRGRDAMLVADEAHRMKSPKAKRTKRMLKLRTLVNYRRILTGTIVANNPLDVWAPFEFLDPRILDCGNWFLFRRTYAIMQTRHLHGRSFQEVIGYQRQDELKATIAKYSYSVTAAECLDLPPRQYQRIPVPMSAEQKKLYGQMTDELFAEWNGEVMTAPLALTQLLRFQQLLGGFFVPDEQSPVPLKQENPRMTILFDLLDSVDGKAIIWTRFRAERAQIAQKLRDIYGADSVAEVALKTMAEEEIDHFRTHETCRFMVANPEGTASEGRDLSMASTMIYYSNSFKLTARLQSEARCDKKDKKTPVTVIDLVARNSVDSKIVRTLRDKKDVAAGFSGEQLREWLRA